MCCPVCDGMLVTTFPHGHKQLEQQYLAICAEYLMPSRGGQVRCPYGSGLSAEVTVALCHLPSP
jgi:hypothetical protein